MLILVVEHDEDFRTALSDALREAGHRVEAYCTPAEVPLEHLQAVDLVFSDYHLPLRTGVQLADAFHALYPRVPVVILTADPSRLVDAEVSRRPFTRLFRKPLGYAELVALIADVVANLEPDGENLHPKVPDNGKKRPTTSSKVRTRLAHRRPH